MPKLIGMDHRVTLADQLRSEEGPVVLIDTSVSPPEDAGCFMTSWRADAAIMEARSGSISTQLHRGIAGGGAFLNDAVRQSAAHFRAVFADPEFQARSAEYSASATVSPHLSRRVESPLSASLELRPLPRSLSKVRAGRPWRTHIASLEVHN